MKDPVQQEESNLGEITSLMAALEGEVQELEKNIHRIEGMFEQLLSEPIPVSSKTSEAPRCQSSLANQLQNLLGMVVRTNNALRSISERCQL